MVNGRVEEIEAAIIPTVAQERLAEDVLDGI